MTATEEFTKCSFYRENLSRVLGCRLSDELDAFYDLEKRFPGVAEKAIRVAARDHELPSIGFWLCEAKYTALVGLKELTDNEREALREVGVALSFKELKARYVWIPTASPEWVRVAGSALAGFIYGDIDGEGFREKVMAAVATAHHTP